MLLAVAHLAVVAKNSNSSSGSGSRSSSSSRGRAGADARSREMGSERAVSLLCAMCWGFLF